MHFGMNIHFGMNSQTKKGLHYKLGVGVNLYYLIISRLFPM